MAAALAMERRCCREHRVSKKVQLGITGCPRISRSAPVFFFSLLSPSLPFLFYIRGNCRDFASPSSRIFIPSRYSSYSARLSRENSIYPFRRNFNATRIRISRDRSSKRLFEAFDRFDYVKKKKKKKKKERKKEIKDYSMYTNALNTLSSSAYMF